MTTVVDMKLRHEEMVGAAVVDRELRHKVVPDTTTVVDREMRRKEIVVTTVVDRELRHEEMVGTAVVDRELRHKEPPHHSTVVSGPAGAETHQAMTADRAPHDASQDRLLLVFARAEALLPPEHAIEFRNFISRLLNTNKFAECD